MVAYVPVWVRELALVQRQHPGTAVLEGLAVEAASGEPVAGAKVQVWALAQAWQNQPLVELTAVQTDEHGLYHLKGLNGRTHVVLAQHGDQQVAAAQAVALREHHQPEEKYRQTVLFTDRSINRPGQTIRFKGILIAVDHAADTYAVVSGETMTVYFHDVSGKEIARESFRSNDYGSFNGSFTAPRDRLLGQMTLRTSHHPRDWVSVRIKEYKRPAFQVELPPPAASPRLNDRVELRGTARAYTGAATDGVVVRWRVVREARYPHWRLRRRWGIRPTQPESREIAHGLATTDIDGTFEIDFTALPEPNATAAGDPVFHFTVHADVTDAAGETRSAQREIRVGFTALSLSLTADDWLEMDQPFELSIRTASLDGTGQAAAGTLKIHRLEAPDRVRRPPPATWNPHRPHVTGGSGAAGANATDASDPENWPLGRMALR